MSYALSNHISGKRRRKRHKRKITMADGIGVKPSNVARRMASEKSSEVSITFVEAQRENRQATKKWKVKARKFAFGTAIGLHAVAIIFFAVWFVKRQFYR